MHNKDQSNLGFSVRSGGAGPQTVIGHNGGGGRDPSSCFQEDTLDDRSQMTKAKGHKMKE